MSRNETEIKYEKLIAECDQLIRSGKINSVSNRISKLNLAQVPRSFRQTLAKICRRAGLISQGLRLLHPVIRNENVNIDPPLPGEICEYSVLLSRNGSVQEALNLLDGIDVTNMPEALMSSAYCHMARWDYSVAIGFLESYLNLTVDPYSKLIAQVNLASSYLATSQLEPAAQLCTESIWMAEEAGASRLAGNCLEIRSQVYFQDGDFNKARADLNRASEIFAFTQSYDQLFIQKWQAVMTAIEKKSLEPLLEFRKKAVSRKHWESVREADLFSIKVQFDQKALDYLIYGTPMPAYRKRISQIAGTQASENFIYGSGNSRCLDLKTGQISGVRGFNPGKKIHQVIAALMRDFYVPRNVGTLFSDLYPDEFFDINSSTLKIRQLLWRTRNWLKENKIPATIQQNENTYRVSIQGDFGFRIYLEQPPIQTTFIKWMQLKNRFPAGVVFSAEEACQKLNWPRTSFRLVINWALSNGHLRRFGIGKSTAYLIGPPLAYQHLKSVA